MEAAVVPHVTLMRLFACCPQVFALATVPGIAIFGGTAPAGITPHTIWFGKAGKMVAMSIRNKYLCY